MLEKTAKNRQWRCLSQRFFGRILQSGQIRTILRALGTIPSNGRRRVGPGEPMIDSSLGLWFDSDCRQKDKSQIISMLEPIRGGIHSRHPTYGRHTENSSSENSRILTCILTVQA
jgi:hypothetical protein